MFFLSSHVSRFFSHCATHYIVLGDRDLIGFLGQVMTGRTKIRKQTQRRKDANISKVGIFSNLDSFAYLSHLDCVESFHLRI
mgnify:CR=1 FL=1